MQKAFATIRFAVPAGIVAATLLTVGAAVAAPAPSKPSQPAYGTAVSAAQAKPAAKSVAKPAAKPAAKSAVKPAAKPAAKPGDKRAVKPSARNMDHRTKGAKAGKAKPGATFKPTGGKVIKTYVGPLKKLPRRTPAKKP